MKAKFLNQDGSLLLDSFAVPRSPGQSTLCSWVIIKSWYLDRALSCTKNNTKKQQQELVRVSIYAFGIPSANSKLFS